MPSLITSGVGYPEFLRDLQAIVEHVVQEKFKSGQFSATPQSPIGGIELAQEVTGLSKSRIYALVSQRGICHSRRGGRLYFNRADLLEWVAAGNREQKTR